MVIHFRHVPIYVRVAFIQISGTVEPVVDIPPQAHFLPVGSYAVLSALSIGKISNTVRIAKTTVDTVQMAASFLGPVWIPDASFDCPVRRNLR